MSKPVFLIGPSGIGKTTLGKQVCRSLGFVFCDLDELVAQHMRESAGTLLPKVGADGFLCCCRAALQDELQNHHDRQLIVAVGAGCLESERAPRWLSQETTIAITADADEAYDRIKRERSESRTREEYKSGKFFVGRRALYTRANKIVHTTNQTKEQSIAALVVHLGDITGGSVTAP